MRIVRFAGMAVVLVLIPTAGRTQTLAPEMAKQVDNVFAKWDRADSPGCALGVYRGGQIVYKRGYGMEDLNEDVHITPGTVFHVASMSKQFTAGSIVLLAQQGKLSLDDDVREIHYRAAGFRTENHDSESRAPHQRTPGSMESAGAGRVEVFQGSDYERGRNVRDDAPERTELQARRAPRVLQYGLYAKWG